VNIITYVPYPKALNKFAETTQKRKNSFHKSKSSIGSEFIVNSVQPDVMNQDCERCESKDS
jgi:hypothetical protein